MNENFDQSHNIFDYIPDKWKQFGKSEYYDHDYYNPCQ